MLKWILNLESMLVSNTKMIIMFGMYVLSGYLCHLTIFCKLVRHVIQYLIQEGLSVCSYVDDLLLTDKPELIEVRKEKLILTLNKLGLCDSFK